jgi:hypothetical protein
MPYYMRLSLYVGLVVVFWTVSALIFHSESRPAFSSTLPSPPPASDAQASIKSAFLHAWQGYSTYAWGQDELCSLSQVTAT